MASAVEALVPQMRDMAKGEDSTVVRGSSFWRVVAEDPARLHHASPICKRRLKISIGIDAAHSNALSTQAYTACQSLWLAMAHPKFRAWLGRRSFGGGEPRRFPIWPSPPAVRWACPATCELQSAKSAAACADGIWAGRSHSQTTRTPTAP